MKFSILSLILRFKSLPKVNESRWWGPWVRPNDFTPDFQPLCTVHKGAFLACVKHTLSSVEGSFLFRLFQCHLLWGFPAVSSTLCKYYNSFTAASTPWDSQDPVTLTMWLHTVGIGTHEISENLIGITIGRNLEHKFAILR